MMKRSQLLIAAGIGILLVVALVNCSSQAGNKAAEGPVSGQAVFEKTCSVCHGSDGKKGIAGATDLSLSTLSIDDRKAIVRLGKGTMAGWEGVLSGEEISAVALYLDSLRVN